MIRNLVTFCALNLLLAYREALAYPNGAGGCTSGLPAVGGSHIEINQKSVIPGFLDQSGVSFTIGRQQLSKETVNVFPLGEDLLVEASSSNLPIRGILVRIERGDGIDSTGALVPGENTKLADYVCSPPATGITHFDSENKNAAKGTIRFDEAIESITCEVTVVFANNDTLSSFAYDSFDLQFEGSTSTEEPLSAAPSDPTISVYPTTTAPSAPSDPATSEPTMVDTKATNGSMHPSSEIVLTLSPTNTTENNGSPSPKSKPTSTKSSGAKGCSKNKNLKICNKGSTRSKMTKSTKTSKKRTQASQKSSHKKIEKSTKAPRSASNDGNAKVGSRRLLLRRV
jgi:hypothetical protein